MNINWKKIGRGNWTLNENVAVAKDWATKDWYPVINGRWHTLRSCIRQEDAIEEAERLAKEEGYL